MFFRYFYGDVGQLEESVDSKPIQCGFESHHRYNMVILAERFRRRIVVPVYVGSNPTGHPNI